jgi:hypothetical protein
MISDWKEILPTDDLLGGLLTKLGVPKCSRSLVNGLCDVALCDT